MSVFYISHIFYITLNNFFTLTLGFFFFLPFIFSHKNWTDTKTISTQKTEKIFFDRLKCVGRNYLPFSVFKSLADTILCAAGRASLAWVKTSGSIPEKLHSSPVTALDTTWLGIDTYSTLSPI